MVRFKLKAEGPLSYIDFYDQSGSVIGGTLCYSVVVSRLVEGLLELGSEHPLVKLLEPAVFHPEVLPKVLNRFGDVRALVSLYPARKEAIADFVVLHLDTIIGSDVKDIQWIVEVLPEHARALISPLLDRPRLTQPDIAFLCNLRGDESPEPAMDRLALRTRFFFQRRCPLLDDTCRNVPDTIAAP